jgi:hypothetical protein
MRMVHGGRKRPLGTPYAQVSWMSPRDRAMSGGIMSDLLYIGLTIVVFAALFLLVRGVERVER